MKARVPKGAGNNAQNMNQMIRQAQKMQDQITELFAFVLFLIFGGKNSVKLFLRDQSLLDKMFTDRNVFHDKLTPFFAAIILIYLTFRRDETPLLFFITSPALPFRNEEANQPDLSYLPDHSAKQIVEQ